METQRSQDGANRRSQPVIIVVEVPQDFVCEGASIAQSDCDVCFRPPIRSNLADQIPPQTECSIIGARQSQLEIFPALIRQNTFGHTPMKWSERCLENALCSHPSTDRMS